MQPLPQPRPRPLPIGRPVPSWWPPSPDGLPNQGYGDPRPSQIPIGATSPVSGVGTRSDPRAQPRQGIAHNFRPPRKGEREKKGTLLKGPAWELAGAAMNAVTESADFVDAVFGALPQKLRSELWRKNGKHPLSYKKKLQALWDYYNQIDIPTAVKNVILNQLQDMIIGKINNAGTKALAKLTRNGNMPGSKLGYSRRVPQVDWGSLGL